MMSPTGMSMKMNGGIRPQEAAVVVAVAEIPRQAEHEGDLGHLAGLKIHDAEVDPRTGAVDGLDDRFGDKGQEHEDQQAQGHGKEGVGGRPQEPGVGQEHQRQGGEGDEQVALLVAGRVGRKVQGDVVHRLDAQKGEAQGGGKGEPGRSWVWPGRPGERR